MKYIKFGNLKVRTIISLAFWSFLVLFLTHYYMRVSVSISSTPFEKLVFDFSMFYLRYIYPVIVILLIKCVFEMLFIVLNSIKKD